ncbi:MAG: hypothetical protein AB1744_07340 [Candidatus Zixiibacteriota bacterium]
MSLKENDVDLIIRLLRGKLSAHQRRELEARLASDGPLAQLRAIIGELLAASETADDSLLRSAAKQVAQRMFEDYQRRGCPGRRKQGITLFDSKLLPLPEGVRPATVDTRRLKYRLGDLVLTISLYPISPHSYEMIGQIIEAKTDRPFEVIVSGGKTDQSARTDRFHVFRFERLETGRYMLRLKRGRILIGVVDIDL